MPVRYYECKECSEEFRTLKKEPKCPNKCNKELKQVIKAPQSKYMEKTDSYRNKSKTKGLNAVLKERARNHSRDNEIMDLAQTNDLKTAKDNQWLVENSDGSLRKRKKIDDL